MDFGASTFEFATATRIVFGRGRRSGLPEIIAELGRRALVVTGRTPERHAELVDALERAHIAVSTLTVAGEPTTEDARRAVEAGARHRADVVIGIGGGSALDLGKAAAALIASGGDPMDYLEVVGKGLPLTAPPLPYVAVPTTSGTGAEVTKNAVLDATEHGVKVSLRSPLMLPRVALLDPELTVGVPPEVTASTGFDALAQVIEPLTSCQANPLTDALCREGIVRGARSLVRAYEHGSDLDAREDMALTSLLGGLALANAKLGAVHGFAGPLGGMFHAPHGALCAALLPASIHANVEALRTRQPGSSALRRFDEVGRLLTGRMDATASDAIEWCRATRARLSIPGLSAYGIERADFATIVEKAQSASSMKGNPIVLTSDELSALLAEAL